MLWILILNFVVRIIVSDGQMIWYSLMYIQFESLRNRGVGVDPCVGGILPGTLGLDRSLQLYIRGIDIQPKIF